MDKVHCRSHPFPKYTVDYIHHLVIHNVIYSVKHLMDGWDQIALFPWDILDVTKLTRSQLLVVANLAQIWAMSIFITHV